MVNPCTELDLGYDCSAYTGLHDEVKAKLEKIFFNFTKTEPVPFQQLLSDAIRNIEKQSDEWHARWNGLGSMVAPPAPQPVTGGFVKELEADLGEPVTAAEAAEILSEIIEEEFSLYP